MYFAVKGEGAFWDGRKIMPSINTNLSQCLVATGWPYDRQTSEQVVETISTFWSQCQEVRTSGSAALNICHVASGVFDGYWDEIKGKSVEEIKEEQRPENLLFKTIRAYGFVRETPLIIASCFMIPPRDSLPIRPV